MTLTRGPSGVRFVVLTWGDMFWLVLGYELRRGRVHVMMELEQ